MDKNLKRVNEIQVNYFLQDNPCVYYTWTRIYSSERR